MREKREAGMPPCSIIRHVASSRYLNEFIGMTQHITGKLMVPDWG
jgi:hypothetical protein